MNARTCLTATLIAALSLSAFAQSKPAKPVEPLPPETILVEDGKTRVTALDFEANMLRIPEESRAAFRVSYDRVVAVVDNIFVARSVAQKARDAGLDKDPAVQARIRQLEDGLLADLYMQKLDKDFANPDLEQRAREIYTADKDKFRTDDEAHIQQILIGVSCRTKDAALELARRAADEVRSGKDFLEVAAKYSDAGDKAPKGGDVPAGSVKKLVDGVREAVAKMKPGEVSEPIESQFGIHVVKLIDRKPGVVKRYEVVRKDIIAAELDAARRKRLDDVVTGVRNSKTVVTHNDNVQKLVAPGIDLNELTEKARAANKGK